MHLNGRSLRRPTMRCCASRHPMAEEYRYLVGDLGATFGRMGGRISNRSKWRLDDYLEEGFIEKVEAGVLHLDYDGFDSGMDRVSLEHARWFASIISGLSHKQVRRV